ncbi:MAG: hypothetical protein ACXQTW_00515 [Candidatus Methanospirareceae archaeon]
MRSSSIETEEWGEAERARLRREREALKRRMERLNKEIEEYEEKKEEMKASLEEEKDPELDPEFPRMVERGIMRIINKQVELSKSREELIKRMKELDAEEQQLNALLGHERYPEWLELKKKRDEAAEEVARLEAKMKQLMDSIIIDTARR